MPDDAWEYHTRKALNDAAYKGLDYVPYSSTMPVQPKTDEPKFMWVRLWFQSADRDDGQALHAKRLSALHRRRRAHTEGVRRENLRQACKLDHKLAHMAGISSSIYSMQCNYFVVYIQR